MLKIGIIGCGGMGKHHSRNLVKIPNVQITAAADIDANALQAYQAEFHPDKTYDNFNSLDADSNVDAVLVCLPTYLHEAAVVAAAKAGKQIFSEKPMAMSIASAENMIAVCDKADVKLMLGFVRRFDNDWGTFRRLVQEGKLGRPLVWRHIIASGGPVNPWFLDKEKGGGPIIDGAIHDIDFANWLFGDCVWTEGIARSFKSTAYDTATVSLGYASGDELLLSWTWGLPAGALGLIGQDAIGPSGAVLFPGSFSAKDLPADFDQNKYGAYLLDTGNKREVIPFERKDMFMKEMEHFVDCCVNDKTPSVGGNEGLKAITACLQAMEKARKV